MKSKRSWHGSQYGKMAYAHIVCDDITRILCHDWKCAFCTREHKNTLMAWMHTEKATSNLVKSQKSVFSRQHCVRMNLTIARVTSQVSTPLDANVNWLRCFHEYADYKQNTHLSKVDGWNIRFVLLNVVFGVVTVTIALAHRIVLCKLPHNTHTRQI